MGALLIILGIILILAKKDKKRGKRRRTGWGKSDWEKTCDDGGKFFGW
ncbi:MAG: hypothetical protein MJZ12_03245 [Prevotella sp.]|nr:hypothetical protein [Prevotella sp.]